MNKIGCFACNRQKYQIKGETRVVYKEKLIELIQIYKNRDFVYGLIACQRCIRQVVKVLYN